MDTNCTFLSYNPTGFNSVKSKWIKDLIDVTSADFISIQEHFRKSKTIENYFSQEFPNQSGYILPGYRESGTITGRPKGGLAMLSNNNIKVKKTRITTNSFRVQAQVLNLPNTKLLWINSYLPNDPLTEVFDSTELTEVLSEISKILESTVFDDVVWIGDLNWDKTRNSGFSNIMNNFISDKNLMDVWDKFPVDFTHIHTDLKSTSILDRILVNERLLNIITDAGVLHIGDNSSRHAPIFFKFDAGNIPPNKITREKILRKPNWNKADKAQIDEYTETLYFTIEGIKSPCDINCKDVNCTINSHSETRDNYMMDILGAIIETSYNTIPLN